MSAQKPFFAKEHSGLVCGLSGIVCAIAIRDDHPALAALSAALAAWMATYFWCYTAWKAFR